MSTVDHLVLATPDLAATVADVGRLTGLEPVPGGAHQGLGTRNHLLGLGEGAYLEIVGPDTEQPDPDRPRPFGIDNLREARIAAWALRVDDIDTAVAGARRAGHDPGEPWTMSRRTPDGRDLRWRLTLDHSGGDTGLVPFLIDWGTAPHPSTALPVAPLVGLEAVHPEPAALERALTALGAELAVKAGNRAALAATVLGTDELVVLH